ncbi:MAG: oligosaccharide flippase family protein [Clostridiales bacterium]|nr:oligosaccharide flippase family protein [Clostridiales bacterium]
MYKRLLKDASLYSVSSLLSRGFSFITVPIYTRILSPADYGALDLLSYLSVLVPLFACAALDQAVARFYLEASTEKDKQKIASTVLYYTIFIFFIFIPIADFMARYIATTWLSNQVTKGTVLLVFVFIWVHSLFYIANNQLKYLFLSKQFAFCNIGNTILSTILCFSFIVFLRWGVWGVFLGQMIGQGCFALVSLFFARKSYALIFDWEWLRKMLRYSLPLVPSTLSFYVMQYVDRYVINQLKGLGDVGIYGIGARLASLMNLFLVGFQGAWHPIVMKTFKEPGAPSRFKVVFNYYIFIASAILIGISLFGREVLLVLTTATFSGGYVVVPMLTFSAILASIAGYFTYGIQISKRSSIRLIINVIGLVVNIVLNYCFIGYWGIVGAAIATLLTFLFISIAGMIVSQKLYYVPYEWFRLAIVAIISVFCSNLVLVLPLKVSLLIIGTKFILCLISLLFIAKLLRINNLKQLFLEAKNFG